MRTVNTWLPVFPGFYNTIFEPSTDDELSYINDERAAKELPALKDDSDVDWDYQEYYNKVVKDIAQFIERELKAENLISDITVQGIQSPKEYNFRNDSCNIAVKLTKKNEKQISSYLKEHASEFAHYLKSKYTSCSGFISSYSNDVDEFMTGEPLEHEHKLGSILDFICSVMEIDQERVYNSVEASVSAKNFDEVTEKIKE